MGRQMAMVRRARAYLEDLRDIKRETTIEAYRVELQLIIRDAIRLHLPADIRRWTERDILDLKRDWEARLMPKGLHKRFSVMARFLAFHGNHTVDDMRSRKRLRLPAPNRGLVRWPDEDQRERLIGKALPNERLILILAFYLGLRRKEIAGLAMRDLTDTEILVDGKGGEIGTLPLEGPVAAEVRHYLQVVRPGIIREARTAGCWSAAPDGLLIRYWRGSLKSYTPQMVSTAMRTLSKRVGIPYACHDGRRAFSRETSRYAMPIEDLSRILRHKSLDTTRDYIGLEHPRLRASLQRYYAASGTKTSIASDSIQT